ncbi:MAG TPA: hypothetical protein VG326_08470 [Tepidisphaeraceae bacterium]|jgi:hypothetical protein|nr:hypothetical protein [Tepidisphaeraceae bacterium]
MSQWAKRFNQGQMAVWISRMERARRGGRSRYIWSRIVPLYIAGGIFLVYFVAARILQISIGFHVLSIYLAITVIVSILGGYVHGLQLWKKLEANYAAAIEDRVKIGPTGHTHISTLPKEK